MLKLDMRMARRSFFDRKVVKDAVDRARQQALVKSAALVRVIAQRSMRYRKWKPDGKGAPPGSPPFARTGRGNKSALIRKGTWFYYDASTKSAVVGPVRLPSGGTGAPSTMEFGGTARARDARTVRKVGGSGEIRVSHGATGRDKQGRYTSVGGRSTKVVRTSSGQRVRVTYAKLETAEQAARATRINDELYRPRSAAVRVAARPFMAPALRNAAPSMPSHWKNTVRAA